MEPPWFTLCNRYSRSFVLRFRVNDNLQPKENGSDGVNAVAGWQCGCDGWRPGSRRSGDEGEEIERSPAVTPQKATPQNTLDIAVEVATVDQLFNAPPITPFSDRDVEILGISGLSYIARQLQTHRRDWQRVRLVLRLPPDQITPGTESRLVDALRRYCRAKIADNALEIHLIRVRNAVGLAITAAIVIGIIALAYVLFSGILAGTPMAAQYLVAGTISLFSWVVLWDVLEALIFDPIPLLRENSALRKISNLEIVVEPGRACESLPGTEH